MTLNHKKFISGEGIDLHLQDNLALVHCAFTGHLPKTCNSTSFFFVLVEDEC